MREGINWEIGLTCIHIYTKLHILLYTKQITNKDLLYSIAYSTQHSVKVYMGKEWSIWEMSGYMYMYN